MAKLPTVKIKFGGSFKTINESDFDPKQMELFEPAPDPVADAGEELTRESIRTMKKGDVRELLEAHGIEEVPSTVAEMREMAEAVVFVGDIEPDAIAPAPEPVDDDDQPGFDFDDDDDLLN